MRSSLDSATKDRNISTINFSLYTPDSPTSYDFEQIARTFPLPVGNGRILPGRSKRDRDTNPLDFPVEIALANEEDDLGRDLDSNSGDSHRGSGSWRNKGLAAWRSQCHRDANVSAISLPTTGDRSPVVPEKRNPSVISLPAFMPELCNSTATSATFALSPMGDQTFRGSQRQHHIDIPTFAKPDEPVTAFEEEHDISPRNSQGKKIIRLRVAAGTVLADLDPACPSCDHVTSVLQFSPLTVGLASPLMFPALPSSSSYTNQPLPRVPEESPSRLSAHDSPLFTMSPCLSNASPSQSSILSPRLISTANRTLLTYSRSSVVPLRHSAVSESAMPTLALLSSPLPPPTNGSTESSTFGIHRAHPPLDTLSFGLGLIHEDDVREERIGRKHNSNPTSPAVIANRTQLQPSDTARSLSFRRRTHSKDPSGQWGENHLTPGLPPPQGPLPDPRHASPGQECEAIHIARHGVNEITDDHPRQNSGWNINVKGILKELPYTSAIVAKC